MASWNEETTGFGELEVFTGGYDRGAATSKDGIDAAAAAAYRPLWV